MIGSVNGVVRGVVRDTVVIEVGGVGYRVFTPAAVLAKAAEEALIFLWIHHAQRETAQDLYGFETKEDLLWFELLLSVSGIGPKSALAILNSVDTASLSKAIAMRDAAGLSKSFGIGKKTAEKIVLELREKVGVAVSATPQEGSDNEVIDALTGLGYSLREAREAVHALPESARDTESKIREAIKIASRAAAR